jgi:hypothetical protein
VKAHIRPDPLLTLCLILAMCTLLYSNSLASQGAQNRKETQAAGQSLASELKHNDSKTQEG